MERTQARSGWSIADIASALGVSASSYYRWRDRKNWEASGDEPPPPAQPYEILPEERDAVADYALKHPDIRHRELAWRMVDEDVAYVSASSVYRILRYRELVCPWRLRSKRSRKPHEKASYPDEIWAVDIKYVLVGDRHYYLISFIDEYSRFIVYHELLRNMDGNSVSLAAQSALETLPLDAKGRPLADPIIRSDNGSCFISGEFGKVLDEYGLTHYRIKPHCPEENGVVERVHRTLDEALEGEEMNDYYQASDIIAKKVSWYNTERLHSAIDFLRPIDYYRGDPESLREDRRRKMAQARHRRKERNLLIRQRTLPFTGAEVVTNS